MVDAQTISIVFAGLSIGIAAFYYTMTLRNTQRAQQVQLETRQAQLFMETYRDFKSSEVQRAFIDIVRIWEWDGYDDFLEKYAYPNNWEEWEKVLLLITTYEGLGVLVYRNLIGITMIDELMRSYIVLFWEKVSPVIFEMRKANPLNAEWTEYLYNEVKKIESTPAYTLNNP